MSLDARPIPEWFSNLFGFAVPAPDGQAVQVAGKDYVLDRGILRAEVLASRDQAQTADAFGFKWQQLGTFDGDVAVSRSRDWLLERYGDVAEASWWTEYHDAPVLLDAGCGAALSS